MKKPLTEFSSLHGFGDKVYTLENNKIQEYEVYRVIFCDYDRDKHGNECTRHRGGYDVEYGIRKYDETQNKLINNIINKNNIDQIYFWSKQELLESL